MTLIDHQTHSIFLEGDGLDGACVYFYAGSTCCNRRIISSGSVSTVVSQNLHHCQSSHDAEHSVNHFRGQQPVITVVLFIIVVFHVSLFKHCCNLLELD